VTDKRQGTFGRHRLEPVAVNGADPRRRFAVRDLSGEVRRPSKVGKRMFCQFDMPFRNV
jgi:hypothetical protein